MEQTAAQFLTPGTDADIAQVAENNPGGSPSEKAYGAEYNSLGIKTNLVIPLTDNQPSNSAGVKSVVGSSSTPTTTSPINASGNVTSSSQMGYNIGTGWWMGFDQGIPKFFLGAAAGNKVLWDGSTLTITGVLTAGSINIPDTTTPASFHTDTSGNSWWGATTLGAAPASILSDGSAQFASIQIGGYIGLNQSTIFENSTRFDVSGVVGTGTITFGQGGASMLTGTTNPSHAIMDWTDNGRSSLTGSPSSNFSIYLDIINSSNGTIYVGLGNIVMSGASFDFTQYHAGFKITGGNLYATQADGFTETATQMYTGLVSGTQLSLIVKVHNPGGSITSIDYYKSRNGAAFSKVTLTTNIPVINEVISYGITNDGTTTTSQFHVQSCSYAR